MNRTFGLHEYYQQLYIASPDLLYTRDIFIVSRGSMRGTRS